MSLHSDARAVAGTHRPSDAEGPIAPSTAPRSWRLFVAFGVAMLFLARVTIQLADVQLLDRSGYAARASSEVNQSLPIVASRGTIVDRFGNVLAVDVERRSLYVVPAQIDPGEAANLAMRISEVIDVPAEKILALLIDTNRAWVPVARWLPDDQADQIERMAQESLYLVYESHRFYPQGRFAPHVIGATNLNGMGIAGVEASFDDVLRGTNGVITAEVDIHQQPIWSRPYERVEPVNGSQVQLTIDPYIQHLAEDQLGKAIDIHGASGGTVIVMDVKTGAIRAMASYPDFDPNDYADVEPEVYNTNPAVGQVYEPGSTFKILTVAAGMQANAFDENSQVIDVGTIRRYDYNLSNYDFNGHGPITPGGVLYYSSNIGALLFAEQMGESVFYKAVDDFGFGKLTGIELPGETGGIYWKPGSENYTPINLNTNSYGQGIAVTPLQIVRMTAAVGNNGVMMQPYIVQKRCNRDGTCVDTEPVMQSQPISARVALKVRGMLMRSANHYVNARQPDDLWLVPGFRVGAKTGTSSIPDGYGGYTGQTIGSVAGMAPLEAPRYAVLVKIDRPIDDIYGIATALPVYRRIVAELMRYDRIAPNNALVGDGQRAGVVYGN